MAGAGALQSPDRKSTRLNSSHGYSSYAVFCLKKKILVGLMQNVPTVAHAESYAAIVERTALLRRLIQAANEIAHLALTREDAESAVAAAPELLFAVSESSLHRDVVPLEIALRRFADQIMARGDDQPQGVPTGFEHLDAKTGGFHFFYCYGNHRDLHSFPTRRSSDLSVWAEVGGFRDWGLGPQYVPEDWEFWARILGHGYRVKSIRKPLMEYRVHDGNLYGLGTSNLKIGRAHV